MGKHRSKKKKHKQKSNGRKVEASVEHRKYVDTFGSIRKNHLATVDFVYPKDKKGKISAYVFGNHSTNGHAITSTNESSPSNASVPEKGDNLSKLSIDDILKGRSSKTKVDPESTPSVVSSQADDDDSRESEPPAIMGHLSGKSLDEVVKDKVGCRPRANSTDGELALPQRGLCDERTVLTKHQWSSTYLKQRKSSKALGLMNLGNTVSQLMWLLSAIDWAGSNREFS
jgi:hypothetical protein